MAICKTDCCIVLYFSNDICCFDFLTLPRRQHFDSAQRAHDHDMTAKRQEVAYLDAELEQ